MKNCELKETETVTRYNPIINENFGSPYIEMEEVSDGTYVSFESYEKLLNSTSPELYESNLMLLDALQRVLEGTPVSNIDEVIEFSKNALKKQKA